MTAKEYLKKVKDKKRRKFLLTALKMGVKLEVVSSDFRLLKLSWRGRNKILHKSKPYFNLNPSPFLTQNKEITKILLQEYGINVPSGIYAKSYKEALRLMERSKMNFPVVVKPLDAAEGFCVTIGITSKKDLAAAIRMIRHSKDKYSLDLSGIFMIEKLVTGNDFRILVLNKKIIACAQRVPAQIRGDGKSKIYELIKKYNFKRPPSYLLRIDSDARKILRENNYSPSSVLPKGRILQLRKNANISSGGKAVDMTGRVSRRFKKISFACMKALGLNYAGIDIMTNDISSNDPRQPYSIIEVNGDPDYDPHGKPIAHGKGVDVAKILVEEFMNLP
jgi:cyanophycin synthetase